MHVHGSFSEGAGSVDSHSYEASDLGLDVLWWSDHDFRITSNRHATRFGFEGPEESLDRNESWRVRSSREERHKKYLKPDARRTPAGSLAEFTASDAREGERSLRLRMTNAGGKFRGPFKFLGAGRSLAVRPLALDVTLQLEIHAEALGDDARAIVEVQLSEHPAHLDVPYARYVIRYVLDNSAVAPRRTGAIYEIPVRYRPGQWNRLSLPLTRDAIEGFPFIEGDDNALLRMAVGVEARNGATASALFDDLRIEQEVSGAPAYGRQLDLIGRVSRHYPAIRQFQGVELSFALHHLNAFGGGPILLDYDVLAEESGLLHGDPPRLDKRELRPYSTRRAVEIAHQAGALVSYNHMFGVSFEGGDSKRGVDEVFEFLVEHRLFGADLLEVGYRDRGGHDLRDYLGIWDRLALEGLFPVGTGVSDSHGERGSWRGAANNFVSWIYARGPTQSALVAGLRSGRVFFGDLVDFDGRLDLATDRGAVMGQIVVTDLPTARVTLSAQGLAPNDTVVIVEAGERVERLEVHASDFEASHSLRLGERGSSVRVEVYDATGRAKVFSNPIHFVREPPVGGLAPDRTMIDLAGVLSRSIEGFWIRDAAVVEDSGSHVLRIAGRAASGRIELDCSGFGGVPEVTLEKITGSWRLDGKVLLLFDLEGVGSVQITRGDGD
jgi:hypothetical protein